MNNSRTKDLDEFQVIERYFARENQDPRVLLGIGDDAAVVDIDGAAAIATDTLVAGVHFPNDLAGDSVGYRALAVNLSDLAAMGAQPRWCTLALTLPEANSDWLEAFARGFFALAAEHGVELVGGDTSRGPLSVTVHVMGDVDPGQVLTRGGAHAGDDVYVTGLLGAAAAGLALITQGDAGGGAESPGLLERFLRPEPRVTAGLALRGLASAAIDVSDGLLADLGHLSRASGCAADVDLELLPIPEAVRTLFSDTVSETWALSGGDDYELCFTAPASRRQAVRKALQSCATPVQRIGRLKPGSGVHCRRDGQVVTRPATRGYRHFDTASRASQGRFSA